MSEGIRHAAEALRAARAPWARVRSGEQIVAATLAPLTAAGFVVINAIPSDRRNIDHVVVGPTGVFALATRGWRGRAWIAPNGSLMIGRGDESAALRDARAAAVDVERRWIGIDERPPVVPIVALPRAHWSGAETTRSVAVVGRKELAGFIGDRPRILDGAAVRILAEPLLDPARVPVRS